MSTRKPKPKPKQKNLKCYQGKKERKCRGWRTHLHLLLMLVGQLLLLGLVPLKEDLLLQLLLLLELNGKKRRGRYRSPGGYRKTVADHSIVVRDFRKQFRDGKKKKGNNTKKNQKKRQKKKRKETTNQEE
jgi:hypothetical protein